MEIFYKVKGIKMYIIHFSSLHKILYSITINSILCTINPNLTSATPNLTSALVILKNYILVNKFLSNKLENTKDVAAQTYKSS